MYASHLSELHCFELLQSNENNFSFQFNQKHTIPSFHKLNIEFYFRCKRDAFPYTQFFSSFHKRQVLYDCLTIFICAIITALFTYLQLPPRMQHNVIFICAPNFCHAMIHTSHAHTFDVNNTTKMIQFICEMHSLSNCLIWKIAYSRFMYVHSEHCRIQYYNKLVV